MVTKKKIIAIVGGGALSDTFLSDIKRTDVIAGVDRGVLWLLSHDIVPAVAIGDFDSVTKEEFASIQKNVPDTRAQPPHPKYETDMELAVKYAIGQDPKRVVIYGGVGTRMDHTIATLQLLEQFLASGIEAFVQNDTNYIQLAGRGRTILEKRGGYRYASVIPYTQSIQLSLQGFTYNLTKKIITRGQTVGVSNEFIGVRASITIYRGMALVIQSRD